MYNPEVEIVPPVAVQVTAVLLVPLTVVLNCREPPEFTDAVPGVMETETAGGEEVTVTVAEADFVESAELVAVTVNVPGVAGAV